jgi:parallel beta-helix repeat protein
MYALDLQITHYSQISNNTVTQASYGLYLFSSNTNNIFGSPSLGNLITKNHWALVLYNSTANTIIDGNTIADNVWGLYITSNSNGNTIYHNNFVSNTDHAYQDWDVTNTYWNAASEGNYWDNYPGYGPAEGLDYYPLSTPWPLRNLAITNVTANETTAYPGDPVTVNVTVKNLGVITEKAKVTTYYNSTVIGTQTTTLTASAQQTLTFNWNTANAATGDYTISATIDNIPYIESNYTDNSFTDGTVQIGLLGDINGDRTVNNIDLQLLEQAYGAIPSSPNWASSSDLNDDNIIDARDLRILGENYGTTA